MGIFGFSQRKSRLEWTQVESTSELERLLNEQDDQARVFFKHSTRCSISSMALNGFESAWTGNTEALYFIDLLNFRAVSDALAEQTRVRHESPQVIVVRNGEVIYQASHSGIDPRRIKTLVEKA